MKKILCFILALSMLAAFAPAAMAEIELEPLYDAYGLGEEIFVCGKSPVNGITVMLSDFNGSVKYMATLYARELAEGIYITVNRNWDLGEYRLTLAIGEGESQSYYFDVVKDRVDHNPGKKPGGNTRVTATGMDVSDTEIELRFGESTTVTATGDKSSFKWTTDDTDLIALEGENSATAKITAKKTGRATLWVYCGNNFATIYINILPMDRSKLTESQNGDGKSDEPEKKPEREPERADVFNDLEEAAWARESINSLAEAGIVNGMGEGIFAPGAGVTRAQFVAMTVRAFGFTGHGGASFSDVAGSEWYADAVLTAAGNGVVNGVGNGRFDPEAGITCQDAALILNRVAAMKGIKLEKAPADGSDAADYARNAVALLRGNGVITEEMGFSAAEKATRAQSAYMIYGIYRLK